MRRLLLALILLGGCDAAENPCLDATDYALCVQELRYRPPNGPAKEPPPYTAEAAALAWSHWELTYGPLAPADTMAIHWVEGDLWSVRDGEPYPVDGRWNSPNRIYLEVHDHVWESSLAHELLHAAMYQRGILDHDHALPAWQEVGDVNDMIERSLGERR